MRVFYQIYYSIKRIFAEPKPVIVQLVAYAIIILILGSAFSNSFEVTNLDAITVLYCNDDSGDNGELVIDNMTSSEEIKELITLKSVSTISEAETMIQDGDAEALVYIPEDFSTKEKKNLEVYMLESSSVNATVIHNVVDSFTNAFNTATVVYQYMEPTASFVRENYDSIQNDSVDRGIAPDSMTYYAVAMILMMLLFGANYGRSAVSDYYLGTLGDRMKLSPMNSMEQYTGTIIGYSMISFIQVVCMVVFTKIVFDTNWGDNIPFILLVMVSFSIMTTVFGAMLCTITLNDEKASRLVTVFVMVFTFLAGGFVAQDFGTATKLSPSYYARNALFNIIYNGNTKQVWNNIGMIWGLTIVFTIISVVAIRRKKA